MLARLSIRDVVLIDQLDLDFSTGLTILTGETGAGKTILLDALALALGGRGDGGLVRHGQAQGQVTATFELPPGHSAHALLEGQDIEIGDELILRRVQLADGRTRAYVNDQSVSVQALRALASSLVEIHGQHDERALTRFRDPSRARRRLWRPRGAGRERRGRVRRVARGRACARGRARRASPPPSRRPISRDTPTKNSSSSPFGPVRRRRSPPAGSDDAGREGRRRHSARRTTIWPAMRRSCRRSSPFSRRLQRRMPQAPALIEPSVKALDEAMEALEAATQAVEAALAACDFDPRELERCEERLFALRGMAASTRPDRQPARARTEIRRGLRRARGGRDEIVRLEAEVARRAQTPIAPAPRALSAAARKAPARWRRRSTPNCRRSSSSAPNSGSRSRRTRALAAPSGYDRAEFPVQTNPGSRPGPLMKVASGGELARFLLAMKVWLAERGTAPTLVFDEIDTGVGGAVADAIGQRLARLAARAQVLAVTHAPQVAARAQSTSRSPRTTSVEGERVATRWRGSSQASGARRSPACSPAPRSPARRARRPRA